VRERERETKEDEKKEQKKCKPKRRVTVVYGVLLHTHTHTQPSRSAVSRGKQNHRIAPDARRLKWDTLLRRHETGEAGPISVPTQGPLHPHRNEALSEVSGKLSFGVLYLKCREKLQLIECVEKCFR
jgi:hypothetical protein